MENPLRPGPSAEEVNDEWLLRRQRALYAAEQALEAGADPKAVEEALQRAWEDMDKIAHPIGSRVLELLGRLRKE